MTYEISVIAPSKLSKDDRFSDQHCSEHEVKGREAAKSAGSFDSIFCETGSFGRYQIFVAFCAQYSCLLVAGNMYMMTFGMLKPDWSCFDGANRTDQCASTNCTADDHGFYSVVENWRLECDLDYVPHMLTALQPLGQAIGNPVGGHLADHFGRKRVFYAGFVGILISAGVSGFAPSWQLLIGSLFCLGFFLGVFDSVFFVLTMELTSGHRLMMTFCFQWSITFQVLSLVAYLTGNWRYYLFTVNGLCLPLLVLFYFVYESPRWLVQKRRFDDAKRVLDSICVWNRRQFKIDEKSLMNIELDSKKSYSVLLLFSNKRSTCYAVICATSSLFINAAASVILYNVGALAGSPFLNVAIYGLLRLWVPPVLVYLEKRRCWLSRRRPFYLVSLAVVTLCFLGIILTYTAQESGRTEAWTIVATVLAMLGSCINASMFDTASRLYYTELFPTVVRGVAVTTFTVLGNIGMVVSVQLIYLQKFWTPLPYAVVAIIGGLLWICAFLKLPETIDKPLLDTLEEATNSKCSKESTLD